MSTKSRARKARHRESEPMPARSFAAPEYLAWLTVAALLLVTALIFDPTSKDAFRLPKTLAGQSLALLSLFFLAFEWGGRVPWRRLVEAPAARALLPLALVATLTAPFSPHDAHVERGLIGLWIGVLAVWGWSASFTTARLRALLTTLLVPAGLLAAVAILQYHDLWQPFRFQRLQAASRLAVTSFAGNVGDLAAYLVLPALVAQGVLARSGRRLHPLATASLILSLYGLAVTQTFAALAALAAGSLVFWTLVLPRGRRWLASGVALGLVAGVLLVAAPLRERALEKASQLQAGKINSVLTGRLDGWRAALWMTAEHPLAGVGLGAFRAEYAAAKLALLTRGAVFDRAQPYAIFADAHNEPLQIAAECGLGGLLAFGWGAWLVLARLRVKWRAAAADRVAGRADPALAWGVAAAMALLALSNFPFRIALVGFPLALFGAWLFAVEEQP